MSIGLLASVGQAVSGKVQFLFCQEAAAYLMVVFEGDAFLSAIKAAVENQESRAKVARVVHAWMDAVPGAVDCVQSWRTRDPSGELTGCEEMLSELSRVIRLMKFLAYMLGIERTSQPVGVQEVLWIGSFNSKLYPERTLKAYCDEHPAWKRALDEVVRTATSSTRLAPTRDRLEDVFKQMKESGLELTTDRILEVVKEIQDLRKGMRRLDTVRVDEMATDCFMNMAKGIMGGKTGLTTRGAVAVTQGLEIFRHSPGVFDVMEELRNFMTEHAKELAHGDLIDLAKKSADAGVADLDALKGVLEKSQTLEIDPENMGEREDVFSLLVNSVRGLVAEAGS